MQYNYNSTLPKYAMSTSAITRSTQDIAYFHSGLCWVATFGAGFLHMPLYLLHPKYLRISRRRICCMHVKTSEIRGLCKKGVIILLPLTMSLYAGGASLFIGTSACGLRTLKYSRQRIAYKSYSHDILCRLRRTR